MAVAIGSLSLAALCFALALCIAVSQPEIELENERRVPVLDRPLLTSMEKHEGQERGYLVIRDSSGETVYAWDYFREHYHMQYLWRE